MYKVSVIIPTYNRASAFLRALDSVLSQSFVDFEVIIVDDGSTDNTREVLGPYLTKDSRIKYLYRENSGKPAIARNFGIRKASGEYIAFLDSDDLWVDAKLEKMLRFVEQNGFDWACSATYRVSDDKFDEYTILEMPVKYLKKDGESLDLIKYGLFSFTSMPIFPGAVIIKKDVFEAVGGFDEKFLIGEDSDLWMKLEEAGFKGGYLDEPLYFYNKNTTSVSANTIKNLNDNLRLAKKHLKLLPL
jgi:glycosyltransferase involved in cell wall biosynthesis